VLINRSLAVINIILTQPTEAEHCTTHCMQFLWIFIHNYATNATTFTLQHKHMRAISTGRARERYGKGAKCFWNNSYIKNVHTHFFLLFVLTKG